MKYTNKYNYPPEIVAAVKNDTYSKGDSEFSATGLIAPARASVLINRNRHKIVKDIDDCIFLLWGQLGHSLLEKAGMGLSQTLNEKRFFGEIEGTKISAQIDSLSLSDGVLRDFKFTALYGFSKNRPPKSEWVAQMNIQLELMRMNGMDANKLEISGQLKDWRPGESKKESNYPTKVSAQNIPIWPREKTVQYIKDRIKAHRDAEKELPLCTSEETWNGNRCSSYCDAALFCQQYKTKLELESIGAV